MEICPPSWKRRFHTIHLSYLGENELEITYTIKVKIQKWVWGVTYHPSGPEDLKPHAAPWLVCRQSPVPVSPTWHRQLHIAQKWNCRVPAPEAAGSVRTVWTIYVKTRRQRIYVKSCDYTNQQEEQGEDGRWAKKSSSFREVFGKKGIFLSSSGCFLSKACRRDYSAMQTLNVGLARLEAIGFRVKASKLRLNYHRLTHWHEHMHVSPGVSSPQIYIYIYI